MERDSILTPETKLSNYRDIISIFLPFVLIRCTKYTNSKRLAETIAVYTFVCAYYLTRIPRYKDHLPEAIGCMADVVGEDLGNGPNTLNGQLLFENTEAFCAAKALAELDMEESIAMALYYVEKLDLGRIAEITGKAIEKIVGIIGKGQRLFIENLTRTLPRGIVFPVGGIRLYMDYVARGFDKIQFDRITATVMDYLIRQNGNQKGE